MLQSSHKEAVRQAIVAQLEKDLEVTVQASRVAHEAATNDESKAEDQYDTRGLEASYLASAQATRAQEMENSLRALRSFSLKHFQAGDIIALGALVQLQHDEENLWIFLHPCGAGIHVTVAKTEIAVVSPHSPLGAELLGRKCEEEFTLRVKNLDKDYQILALL